MISTDPASLTYAARVLALLPCAKHGADDAARRLVPVRRPALVVVPDLHGELLQRVGLRAVLVEGAPADDRAHAADVALGPGGEADGPDRLGHGGGHGGGQGHEGHILVLINKKKKLCDTCNEKVSSRAVSILIPKA